MIATTGDLSVETIRGYALNPSFDRADIFKHASTYRSDADSNLAHPYPHIFVGSGKFVTREMFYRVVAFAMRAFLDLWQPTAEEWHRVTGMPVGPEHDMLVNRALKALELPFDPNALETWNAEQYLARKPHGKIPPAVPPPSLSRIRPKKKGKR